MKTSRARRPGTSGILGLELRLRPRRRGAGLELRKARFDLGQFAEVLQALELRVKARRCELDLALCESLLTANLVLEAAQLAGRVKNVDRRDRILHLRLR